MSQKDIVLGGPHPGSEPAGGFTLIELMIVVAILAVLAAIALPSYSDYIQRSKISEAISNLSDMRTRMEQFYLDNRTFPTACVTTGTTTTKLNLPPAQKYFAVTCSNLTATTYTVTATGKPAEGMSSAFVYTINEGNVRTSNGPSGQYHNTSCWAIRKNGDC
jgi:type IV pilus assembly protein PilE